jgi:urease subunit beta
VSDPDGRPLVPGEIVVGEAPIEAGGDADVVVMVANTADRPIQVGSHFHFAETNRSLDFDRAAAWGRRLAIPAGTSVRFEPGIEREVGLTPLRGRRQVPGLRGLAHGPLDSPPASGS